MKSRSRTGIVTDDPTKSAAIGCSFEISAVPFPPAIAAGSGDIREWDYFGSTLLGLSFGSEAVIRTDGSAVLIAPGVALAARHVLEPVLTDLLASRISVVAFSVVDSGLVLWRISQIVLIENDVAILRLELSSALPEGGLKLARLTTRLPTIGEPVMIAGIRGSAEMTREAPIAIEVRIGVGEVTAVYPAGRDRVMIPHPCIEVSCLTVGGMSGGPAFDKGGNLLGILTSSFEGESPSYASLWWPLADAQIETCWPAGVVELPTTLLKMQRKGLLVIDEPEALVPQPDGSLSYTSWA